MTELLGFADRITKFARSSKVGTCQKVGKVIDLAPMVIPAREHQPVAVIHLNTSEPRDMLRIAHIATVGYDADQIGLIMEGYVADTLGPNGEIVNRLTGKPFEPGEMQDVALNHNGLARGLLYEAVMLVIVERSGDFVWRSLPFRADPGSTTVSWVDFESDEGREDAIVTTLQRIMRREVQSEMPPGWAQASREGRDAGVTRSLAELGHLIALWTDEKTAERLAATLRTVNDHMHPN